MKRSLLHKLAFLWLPVLLISCNPANRLGKDAEVIKWQSEVAALNALPPSTDPATLLFTGSSSVRLWDSIGSDMLPYHVIKRGYGGASLKDYSFYANALTAPHKAAAIVLFLANDITGSQHDLSQEKVLDYFRLTVKEIRKGHPKTPLVWIEVTPTPSRWNKWPEISKASDLIREYCQQTDGLYFISTREYFNTINGSPDPGLFLPDMLHLNRKGYKLWSSVIKNALDAQLPQLKQNALLN